MRQSKEPEVGGIQPEIWVKPPSIISLVLMNIRENK